MADKPPQNVAETAPDPDENDLDDLDDVLDEFQATSISKPKAPAQSTSSAPSASGPGRPKDASSTAAAAASTSSEEELAKQLQAGMSSLISELDQNPDMQAEFEKMMQELIAAGAAGTDQEAGAHLQEAAKAVSEDTKPKAAASSSSDKKKPAFDSTIRATMDRMAASNTAASTASTQPQSEEDMLAQMMKELTEGGMLGGEGGEGDFNSMLMNMMAHLTNREILYDPMKELHEKFPEWFEKNAGSTNAEDMKRYKEQQVLVGDIVGRFERKGYSDENEHDREYIVERMQKMQSAGSPPSDLVGDMSAAHEALGDFDQGCPTQ